MFPGGWRMMEAEHLEWGVSVPTSGELIQAKTSQAVYVLGHPIRTLMSA